MKAYLIMLSAAFGLVLPMANPAAAAPACAVVDWRHGDTCSFDAPARAFAFGGIADKPGVDPGGEEMDPWIAVEVILNGVPIASCFDSGRPAICRDFARGFPTSLPLVCRVSGTGGPKFFCADPPTLPISVG